MATQADVRRLHQQNPTLSAAQIARRLDCMPEYVRSTFRRLGLTLPGSRVQRSRKPDSLIALGTAARAAGLSVDDIEEIARKRQKPAPRRPFADETSLDGPL